MLLMSCFLNGLKSPSALCLDPFAQAVMGVLSRASVTAFSLLFLCTHSCGVIPMAFYLLQTPTVFSWWLLRERTITGNSFLPPLFIVALGFHLGNQYMHAESLTGWGPLALLLLPKGSLSFLSCSSPPLFPFPPKVSISHH